MKYGSKFRKIQEKEFSAWREEERVVCSEMVSPTSGCLLMEPSSKRLDMKKLTYKEEYKFPPNPVGYANSVTLINSY